MSNTEPKCVLHLSGKASEEFKKLMIIHGKKLKMLTKRDDPGLTPQSFYNSNYLMIMTLQCVIMRYNYDENTETLSGSGCLHDTVGICYQNIPNTMEQGQHQDETVDVPLNTKPTYQPSSSVSKRKFKLKEANIQPYRKKPKMSVFKYHVKKSQIPPYLSTIEYRYIFWMMNIALCDSTPMWAGWN